MFSFHGVLCLKCYLLDVKTNDNTVFVLVDGKGELHNYVYDLLYYGYIKPLVNPGNILEDMLNNTEVLDAWLEEWFQPLHYTSKTTIIVYKARSYNTVKKIHVNALKHGFGIPVNTYPDPLVESLWRHGYMPSAKYILDNGRLVLGDNASVDYEEPSFKYAILEFYRNGVRINDLSREPDSVVVKLWNNRVYKGGLIDTPDLLLGEKIHVLYTGFVDKQWIDMLFPSLLENTLWIDNEIIPVDHYGLVLWSRLSYTPIRFLNHATIGKVLTTIEALEARARKYIVMKDTGRVEPWRPLMELIRRDRGGFVYTPRPGLYFNICQVDFNSLYPS